MSRKLLFEEADKCTYRTPTQEELAEALTVEKLRKKLIKQRDDAERQLAKIDKHPSAVFYDSCGFPYDTRTYIASGRTDLI